MFNENIKYDGTVYFFKKKNHTSFLYSSFVEFLFNSAMILTRQNSFFVNERVIFFFCGIMRQLGAIGNAR